MTRTVLTTLVCAAVLGLTGCGSMTAADCQLQSSANGPYLVKFSQAGALATGCTTTNTPDVFADFWQFDPFENRLIVAFSKQSKLPSPPNPSAAIYGKGNFSAQFPDASDLCTVPTLTTMQVTATKSFAVTNLQFLSTAVYLGTEFKGDVTYTNGTCTRAYTMQALNPAVTCSTKEDCDPFSQPFASGINSKYNTDCIMDAWATAASGKPTVGYCFFVGEFPSNDGWKPVQ
ncbi:MAG TPA: hypothetical protein VMT11_02045 [Myxococcaceae bacterium]|nr:hypothetical protein [Myxococcaceae bacterium]